MQQYSKTTMYRKMREKLSSLISKNEAKRGGELQQGHCNINKRNGLAWFWSGTWKLVCIRRHGEKIRCSLCNEEDNEIHILLKCNGTQRWQDHFWNYKWLQANEEIAHKKIINCTKITELKKLENFSTN